MLDYDTIINTYSSPNHVSFYLHPDSINKREKLFIESTDQTRATENIIVILDLFKIELCIYLLNDIDMII